MDVMRWLRGGWEEAMREEDRVGFIVQVKQSIKTQNTTHTDYRCLRPAASGTDIRGQPHSLLSTSNTST